MDTKSINIVNHFFGLIKNLSADMKLQLISKLSNSLREPEKEPKDDSWKELFGAWKSDESVEKLIEDIRSSRFSDRQIEDL